MDSTPNLDALLGAVAIIIVLGGLFMLLDGIKPLSQDSGKSRVKKQTENDGSSNQATAPTKAPETTQKAVQEPVQNSNDSQS